MTDSAQVASPLPYARTAGILYLIIIIFGMFGEMFVRSGLIVPGDPTATAGRILASQGLFRLGFLADSIMFLCDVALAVLLYVLLKPVNQTMSLMTMGFRLVQSAVLAMNLLNYHAVMLLLKDHDGVAAFETGQINALVSFYLDLHAHGYDLGLLLFGIHCLLLGYLIFKSRFLPKVLGILTAAAGVVYLAGSYTRFLLPDYLSVIAPIYGIAIVAEVSLCLWLLIKGVNTQRWNSEGRML